MDYLRRNVAIGFQPINVIPSNEIKCSKCHKYFPKNLMDDHLTIHIKPKFLLPVSKDNNIKKLGIPKVLKQQLKTQPNDIDVQTLMPEELPKQQKERRNISVPKGVFQPTRDEMFDLQLKTLKVRADEADITSKVGGNLKRKLQYQNELIKLQQNYKIPVETTRLTKRSINVYQNKNVQIKMENQKIQNKKRFTSAKKAQQAYEILSNKDTEITNNSQQKTKKIPCGFFKNTTGVSNSFLTSSKFPNTSRMKNCKDNALYEFFQSVDANLTVSKYDEQKCNCKCSCCGGFYCRVCNSTIPPQFRPATPTDSQEVKSFWKMHFQPNKTCKNCEN